MRFLKLAWLRWKLNSAGGELKKFRALHDVGPIYLANVMQHIAELDREIERLESQPNNNEWRTQ